MEENEEDVAASVSTLALAESTTILSYGMQRLKTTAVCGLCSKAFGGEGSWNVCRREDQANHKACSLCSECVADRENYIRQGGYCMACFNSLIGTYTTPTRNDVTEVLKLCGQAEMFPSKNILANKFIDTQTEMQKQIDDCKEAEDFARLQQGPRKRAQALAEQHARKQKEEEEATRKLKEAEEKMKEMKQQEEQATRKIKEQEEEARRKIEEQQEEAERKIKEQEDEVKEKMKEQEKVAKHQQQTAAKQKKEKEKIEKDQAKAEKAAYTQWAKQMDEEEAVESKKRKAAHPKRITSRGQKIKRAAEIKRQKLCEHEQLVAEKETWLREKNAYETVFDELLNATLQSEEDKESWKAMLTSELARAATEEGMEEEMEQEEEEEGTAHLPPMAN